MRIYPLYAIGLGFSYIVIWLSAQLNQIPFTHNINTYLVNWSLLRLWFWAPRIDGVSWTLECEMFFIIIIVILILINCNKKTALMIISTVGMLFIFMTRNLMGVLDLENFSVYKIIYITCHSSMYIPIISIGVVFFLLGKGKYQKEGRFGISYI